MKIFETVSYHLWKACNMRCKFCYATFQDILTDVLPKGHQTKEQCLRMVGMLAEAGVQKITFAGGEPTLCPFLFDLIRRAKLKGLTTGIITNGSRLNEPYLEPFAQYLDWIGLSIDSLDPEVNKATGRYFRVPKSPFEYWRKCGIIHQMGFKLKINTVVHSLNYFEDMNNFIEAAKPERWKVFQVLPIYGQNCSSVSDLLISKDRFQQFLDMHSRQNALVPEDNEAMTGSYLLIDPAGRFFENSKGSHTYSRPVAEVGVKAALNDINLNRKTFISRGGLYNWD